jgi:Protein of unknown function (DUF4446)
MEGLNGALGGLVHWIQQQPGLALLVLLSANFLTLALAIFGLARVRGLARRQAHMLRGVNGGSLEELLLDYSSNVTQFRGEMDRVLTATDEHAGALRQTIRRVGLHRYDAFANVGGQQSFSLALLDDSSNGIILSGIYSRQEMRVYAKPIVRGRSEVTLTPEEQRAISEAQLPGERA